MPTPPGIPPGRGVPPPRRRATPPQTPTPETETSQTPPPEGGHEKPDKIRRPDQEEYAKLCELTEHAAELRFILEQVSGRRASWGVTYNRVVILAGSGENGVLTWPLDAKQCEEDGLNSEPLILQVDYEVDDSNLTVDEKAFSTMEDAFITIRWGGCRHVAEVDLTRGFQIDLTGPRVIVNVEYPKIVTAQVVPPPPPPPPPNGPIILAPDGPAAPGPPVINNTQPNLVIHASLGIGSTKSTPGITGNTRRTVKFGTVAHGAASAMMPIPRWASSVVFQSPDLVAGMLNFRQFTNVQGTTMLASADLGKLDGASMPIAAGATHAQFFNNGLADVVGVRAIYYLAI